MASPATHPSPYTRVLEEDSNFPEGPLGLTVKVEVKSLSRVRLFATPWTEAHQAPPSMGFSRQEYWSGLLFPKDQTQVSRIADRLFNL